jgi:hypothetical protein
MGTRRLQLSFQQTSLARREGHPMRSKLVGLCVVIAAVCLGTMTNGMAAGGGFTRGCAARDMQIMSMLEVSPSSPQELNDAVLAMIDARMMCFEGQVMDALVLYDSIAERLMLTASPSSLFH